MSRRAPTEAEVPEPKVPPGGERELRKCDENIDYGMQKSEEFYEYEHPPVKNNVEKLREHIAVHNHKVGRLLVKASSRMKCKCSGMSGTCQLQHCWRSLPTFK